jgi:hypothetical protein
MSNGCLQEPDPTQEIQRHPLDERQQKGGDRFGLAVLRPSRHQLQTKVFSRLSPIANAMTVKRVITTKAIAAPSGCFLSLWIRIEQHSSLRKLQNK